MAARRSFRITGSYKIKAGPEQIYHAGVPRVPRTTQAMDRVDPPPVWGADVTIKIFGIGGRGVVEELA